jgi:uracil-DNA glycosylase
MGFCFPGLDAAGSDLPPRPECRAAWHDALFALAPGIETILVVGSHAQAYHLRRLGHERFKGEGMTGLVRRWRDFWASSPRLIPLPHPSWRNSGWLKRNPWFEAELVPELRAAVREALAQAP